MTETTTTPDGELLAMQAMVKYLSPLDRGACTRVLAWAEERFTKGFDSFADIENGSFTRFTEEVVGIAKGIDGMSGHDLLIAAREIARIRSEAPDDETAQVSS